MKGAQVGSNCNIGEHCFVESGAVIGDHAVIKNGVSIWEGVHLGKGVFVGPNAVFTNDMLPRTKFINPNFQAIHTHIHEGASIGANATILCGITIGAYAMIGAGSVVTRDVPAHALVIGSPARVKGWISLKGEKLDFIADGIARDSDGNVYRLSGNACAVERKK